MLKEARIVGDDFQGVEGKTIDSSATGQIKGPRF